jgi:hypothetical protein
MSTQHRFIVRGLIGLLFLVLCAAITPARAASTATYVFYEKFPPSNPEQWHVQTLPDGSKTYIVSGTYRIVRARPGTMRGWPLSVKVPSGFRFNVQLQLLDGSDPYAGVTFWDDLKENFVLFAITPDGKAGLFRHTAGGYTELVSWRSVGAIHQGVHAINSLSVNLDPASAAAGRTFIVNGKSLGKPCRDIWRPALGTMPAAPTGGFKVGVLAGGYAPQGAKKVFVPTQVAVLHASMYDGTNVSATTKCPSH